MDLILHIYIQNIHTYIHRDGRRAISGAFLGFARPPPSPQKCSFGGAFRIGWGSDSVVSILHLSAELRCNSIIGTAVIFCGFQNQEL
jgi:hypothetical protein